MKKINLIVKAAILAMVLPVLIPAGVKVASLSIGSSIVASAATGSNATSGNATQSNGRRRGGDGGSSSRGASGVRADSNNNSISRLSIGAWMQDDKGWWYRSYDGSYPRFRWMELAYDGQTDWYYFDEQGYMLTGWRNINNKWYFLFEKTGGRALKGAMAKGWIQINGKWYYLYGKNEGDNPEGSMAKGWVQVNGKWYYLYEKGEGDKPEGSMAANTTIGRYRVDAEGAWVK